MAERQEGIPVTPAEREHAEALHVRAVDVVIDAGQQFHFLGAVAAEQRIVDDEDVPARLARQRRDVFWMMAVPKSSVNLRQWMAQGFRKLKYDNQILWQFLFQFCLAEVLVHLDHDLIRHFL